MIDANLALKQSSSSYHHQQQQQQQNAQGSQQLLNSKTQQQPQVQLNELYDLLNKLIGGNAAVAAAVKASAPPHQPPVANGKASALYSVTSKSCAWPDCHLLGLKFDSFDAFVKLHLNIEHKLDDRSHKQLLKQIHLVESIEADLNKQKQVLNDMLVHLNNQLDAFKQQQQQQQHQFHHLHHHGQQPSSLNLNDLIAFTQLKQSQQAPPPAAKQPSHQQLQIKTPMSTTSILNVNTNPNGLITPISNVVNGEREAKLSKYANLKRPYEFKTVSHLGEGMCALFIYGM